MIPRRLRKPGARAAADLTVARGTVQWRVVGRRMELDNAVKYVIETRADEDAKWHEDHFTLWANDAASTYARALTRGYRPENEVKDAD